MTKARQEFLDDIEFKVFSDLLIKSAHPLAMESMFSMGAHASRLS
jgi:hypothetical protein